MRVPLHIISLRTVVHNDRHDLLWAYSLEAGRVTFAIPAGQGREASRRRALLMPLGMVECMAEMKPGRDIHIMLEPRAIHPLPGLRSNPMKAAVAMFLAEVLAAVTREGAPDETMFRFVEASVMALDALPAAEVANFHICFLFGLGCLMGIEPDVEGYSQGMIFDMIDGRFRSTAPIHGDFLDPQESQALVTLSRITYANMHAFRLTRHQRNRLLDGILRYFSIHLSQLGQLRTLDVLRTLF